MKQNLINVSNRLPVVVGETVQPASGGLVAALEGLSRDRYDLQWIGWPGTDVPPERKGDVERVLKEQHGCAPVFISADEAGGFYEGVSNSSIWPLLHYMPSKMRYEPQWWDAYRDVNARFAEKILAVAGNDDLVWVHDYHLMLLPAMLRAARPSLRIGFFLHTPFPSYEIFRCHPKRLELLSGLLGADLIGFHTFGYMRHFRSAVLRLMGLDSEIDRIRHGEQMTRLGVYPIGINAGKFEEQLATVEHAEQIRKTVEAHGDKRVILSVERLDYTKGLLHRLDAIDLFLSRWPDRDSIKFIFISVPSRESVGEYKDLLDEVQRQIGRLNGKHATLSNIPIHFIHGSVSFTELCALYAFAEVGLVTPLIDGMNLVAKEYVACQKEDPGSLVLSEFAGAAQELFNAVIVNPYDTKAVAEALEQALRMTPAERARLMGPMRERVMQFDAQNWARSFIDDLDELRPTMDDVADIISVKRRLREAITVGRRVALFLDYDGTLREFERDPMAARPSPAVTRLLDALSGVDGLDVTIISGRKPADLEAFMGQYPFALVGEHGASLRRVGQQAWEQLDRNIDYAWKPGIHRILRQYEESTPGSFVEEKRTSLVWHYRKADPEFGRWKANQLVDELASMMSNEPILVRHGRKIVEVTATEVGKGAAVMRLLENADYDLVLTAGDDQTDETMFRLDVHNLITIKVGDGATHAQHRLSGPAAFRRFMYELLEGRPDPNELPPTVETMISPTVRRYGQGRYTLEPPTVAGEEKI